MTTVFVPGTLKSYARDNVNDIHLYGYASKFKDFIFITEYSTKILKENYVGFLPQNWISLLPEIMIPNVEVKQFLVYTKCSDSLDVKQLLNKISDEKNDCKNFHIDIGQSSGGYMIFVYVRPRNFFLSSFFASLRTIVFYNKMSLVGPTPWQKCKSHFIVDYNRIYIMIEN
jgi:hypothetical protein